MRARELGLKAKISRTQASRLSLAPLPALARLQGADGHSRWVLLAQMWTDFQQTGISMERLGDILNTHTEVPPTTAAQLPPVLGRITLDKVTFRYRPEAAPVLHDVVIDIRPCEVIGIVGRSGSGKGTLTKLVLVQRPKGLYAYLWRMQQGNNPLDGQGQEGQP